MKLSQLIENFVISNDEFEDYLNRATEQLMQELQSGKNPRDAVHELALTFADQHNKSYDAYTRMSDSLSARMHTLELGGSTSTEIAPTDMTNGPDDMGMDDMGSEPEMMTDPMGDMEMETPAQDEMPGDSDMEDYAAVMDNEPEVEESYSPGDENEEGMVSNCCGAPIMDVYQGHGRCSDCKEMASAEKVEESVNEGTNGCADCEWIKDETDGDIDTCDECAAEKRKTNESGILYKETEAMVEESNTSGDYANVVYDYKEDFYMVDIYKDGKKVAEDNGYFGASATGNPLVTVFLKLVKQAGLEAEGLRLVSTGGDEPDENGVFKNGKFNWNKTEGSAEDEKAIRRALDKAETERGEKPKKVSLKKAPWEESVNEAKASILDQLKGIVDDKQAKSIKFDDGSSKVDMFTASAITQVHAKVNDDNKAKIEKMLNTRTGLMKIAKVAMGALKEGKLDEVLPAVGAIAGGVARAAMSKGIKGAATRAGIKGAVKSAFSNEAEEMASKIVRTSSRQSFSEYNEFYKALDSAAKAGKKAGDTIEVGGKKVKLKSNPKEIHNLSDAEMDKIDALALRLNEKSCS